MCKKSHIRVLMTALKKNTISKNSLACKQTLFHLFFFSQARERSRTSMEREKEKWRTSPSIFFFPHLYPLPLAVNNSPAVLACVASVSARVRRERWDEGQKKEWQGRGREEKETLARKPHDFEKLRSPTNAAFDWCGAGGVDYLALETSIKPGMFCLRCVVDLVWSDLCQFIGNDGVRIWREKMDCLLEITST